MCVLRWYEVGPPPLSPFVIVVGAVTGVEFVKMAAGRVTPRYRTCRVGTGNDVSRHGSTRTLVGPQSHRKLFMWLMTNPCGFLTSIDAVVSSYICTRHNNRSVCSSTILLVSWQI